MSLTCLLRECDDCVVILRLCALFWRRHSWSRSVKRGPGGRGGGGLGGGGGGGIRGVAFLSMPPSLPPSSLRKRERGVCESGGTAGVGQSVAAADSCRRRPGCQRVKLPSLVSRQKKPCLPGTRRREAARTAGG